MIRIIFIYISIFISIFVTIFPSHSHEINKDNIDSIIKNFLKKNPDFIKSTLDNYKISLENKKKQNAIKMLKDIGNPGIFLKQADVTIYEFFDYNCGYCKSVVKPIMDLLSEDKKINFVFVEFPILSQQSYFAAKAALASKNQDLYNKFHLSLMKIKGRVNEEKVFKRIKYEHPLFSEQTIKGQKLIRSIQGNRKTYFTGAHLGYGFHEDGIKSSLEVIKIING